MSYRAALVGVVSIQLILASPAFAGLPAGGQVDRPSEAKVDRAFRVALAHLKAGAPPSAVIGRVVSALHDVAVDEGSVRAAVGSALDAAGIAVPSDELDRAFAEQSGPVRAALAANQIPVALAAANANPPRVAFTGGAEGIGLICMMSPGATALCVVAGGVAVVVGVVLLVGYLTSEKEECYRTGKRTSRDFDDRPVVCGPPNRARR